ncbi:MAG: sulfite exporter TauE/SafE family protein [Cyanobacteria bacterium J055]|nr:MAG: sulfite exporter TauE/SafE family protein [Cyanobacteria bacterium J055]
MLLGILTGLASGVLGIGGGLLMVPALMVFGVPILPATATSLVGVLLSSVSGTLRNWRTGELQMELSLLLALGGIPMAQLGAVLGDRLPAAILVFSFAGLQLVAIYLMGLRRQLGEREAENGEALTVDRRIYFFKILGIGVIAGFLSGLFGVGGGLVIVPLQMLFLSIPIKQAVRNSLGAIVLIAASGLARHAYNGNVLWIPGDCLGIGGIMGAQLGTRVLPKLPSRVVNLLFRLLLLGMAGYTIAKGLQEI